MVRYTLSVQGDTGFGKWAITVWALPVTELSCCSTSVHSRREDTVGTGAWGNTRGSNDREFPVKAFRPASCRTMAKFTCVEGSQATWLPERPHSCQVSSSDYITPQHARLAAGLSAVPAPPLQVTEKNVRAPPTASATSPSSLCPCPVCSSLILPQELNLRWEARSHILLKRGLVLPPTSEAQPTGIHHSTFAMR